MIPARRATPDSEAVGSSEDERPWPSSTSFGKMAVNENRMPGLPGGIWSTQKRGSFRMAESAQRHVGLAVNPAHAGLRNANTPSPSASDGTAQLPFAIPLQPTPKLGRSLSHSQGQRDFTSPALSHNQMHNSAALNATSYPLPLELLREENDTESESDFGGKLTQTTSHPPIGSMMRNTTFPLTFEPMHRSTEPRNLDAFTTVKPHARRSDTSTDIPTHDNTHRRTQWQSSLGWDDVPNVNESRRHSLAEIPTRRGSLAGTGAEPTIGRYLTDDTGRDTSELLGGRSSSIAKLTLDDDHQSRHHTSGNNHTGPTNMFSPPYTSPYGPLNPSHDQPRPPQMNMPWVGNRGRPRKELYLVSFKCSRVECYYLYDNSGLQVNTGDAVIVEADRGHDLGIVEHARVNEEFAATQLKTFAEDHIRWLMMHSDNRSGGVNPNAQMPSGAGRSGGADFASRAAQGIMHNGQGTSGSRSPKAIKRLALESEVASLGQKEHAEARAKRTCQAKVTSLRLEMEILDAEMQWDGGKCVFYYYADKYIDFKELVTEMYRNLKRRIWLCAVNPASHSQYAIHQPPSGVGPGAITSPYTGSSFNGNNFNVAHGEDASSYGVPRSYQFSYDTYTPNYPMIPGMVNSFPPEYQMQPPYLYYPNTGPSPHLTTDNRAFSAQSQPTTRLNPMALYSPYGTSGSSSFGIPTPTPATSETGFAAQQHATPASRLGSPPSVATPSINRQASLPLPIGTRRPSSGQADNSMNGMVNNLRHAQASQPRETAWSGTVSNTNENQIHSNQPTLNRQTSANDQLSQVTNTLGLVRMDSRQNRAPTGDPASGGTTR